MTNATINRLPTGVLIDFIESQGAKRAVEDLAALCQEAYGEKSKTVPISKLLELARRHQLAADDRLRLVLAALKVDYGSAVLLDGDNDTVTFKQPDTDKTVAWIDVIGLI